MYTICPLAGERHDQMTSGQTNPTRLTTDVESTIQLLVREAAAEFDGDFLHAFVRSVGRTLDVKNVSIQETVDDPPTQVRVAAYWMGDSFGPSFEYALAHTPCEGVMQGRICAYTQDVQQTFPQDHDLVTLGAQAYLGVPIRDPGGKIVGHISLIDIKPMIDADGYTALLAACRRNHVAAISESRFEILRCLT
jgi:GAF domain-containing protein